jgi:hypothetical protein
MLRIQCNKVVRAMARASQGAFTTQTVVMGMCGDDFWDALVTADPEHGKAHR